MRAWGDGEMELCINSFPSSFPGVHAPQSCGDTARRTTSLSTLHPPSRTKERGGTSRSSKTMKLLKAESTPQRLHVHPRPGGAQRTPLLAKEGPAAAGGGRARGTGHSRPAGRRPCARPLPSERSTAAEVFLLDTMNKPLRAAVLGHCGAPRIKRPFPASEQRRPKKGALSRREANCLRGTAAFPGVPALQLGEPAGSRGGSRTCPPEAGMIYSTLGADCQGPLHGHNLGCSLNRQ